MSPATEASARHRMALAALVVAGFLVVGVLSGVLWERLWTPPDGVVTEAGQWVLGPAEVPDEFSGTGWYVVIAALGGLLPAALVAWWRAGSELAVLVGVLIGSAAAGWVMAATGHALGPPDPRVLATSASASTVLPADLRVGALGAYAVMPAAAMTACLLVWWGLRPRRGGAG